MGFCNDLGTVAGRYLGHAALGNSRVPCRSCFTAEDGMDGVGGA